MDTTAHALVFESLDERTWRLCDRSVSKNDAAAVLACVTQEDSRVEVIWLFGTHATEMYDSFEDVLIDGLLRLHAVRAPSR